MLQGIADSLAGVPSLLLLLHQLEEHSPSGLEVGPQAGAILEDIVANGNAAAAAAIQDFRAATRSRKQALAAKRRQAVLASMNLGQVSSPVELFCDDEQVDDLSALSVLRQQKQAYLSSSKHLQVDSQWRDVDMAGHSLTCSM